MPGEMTEPRTPDRLTPPPRTFGPRRGHGAHPGKVLHPPAGAHPPRLEAQRGSAQFCTVHTGVADPRRSVHRGQVLAHQPRLAPDRADVVQREAGAGAQAQGQCRAQQLSASVPAIQFNHVHLSVPPCPLFRCRALLPCAAQRTPRTGCFIPSRTPPGAACARSRPDRAGPPVPPRSACRPPAIHPPPPHPCGIPRARWPWRGHPP